MAPHPEQTDLLGLPLIDERIDLWLQMMAKWEGLLKRDRLLSGNLLGMLHHDHPREQGLNVRKLLDNPPPDLFNFVRVQEHEIDPQYLEADPSKPEFDFRTVLGVLQAFDGLSIVLVQVFLLHCRRCHLLPGLPR